MDTRTYHYLKKLCEASEFDLLDERHALSILRIQLPMSEAGVEYFMEGLLEDIAFMETNQGYPVFKQEYDRILDDVFPFLTQF